MVERDSRTFGRGGTSSSCCLQPRGSLQLAQRLLEREGTCSVKSHLPKPLAAPQFSPGTFGMSKAQPPTLSQWGGGERCISAFNPGLCWRLAQTLSFGRPAHTSVLVVPEQLLTCMSAPDVCTPHIHLLMHLSVHISHKCFSCTCYIYFHRYICSHMSYTCSSTHIYVCTAHVCSHTNW